MGLAAFNRMRQMEAMKPENIQKEAAAKVEVTPVIDTPATEIAAEPIVEALTETIVADTDNNEEKPARRRRTTK